jgi:hypothetical protein
MKFNEEKNLRYNFSKTAHMVTEPKHRALIYMMRKMPNSFRSCMRGIVIDKKNEQHTRKAHTQNKVSLVTRN